jgi:hypothetical protein
MILTVQDILKDVLEIANKDQNQHYPIRVFNQHLNLITNALLDELAKLYPTNNSIVSILEPFIETLEIKVINGSIQMPENFRNFLSMGVYVRDEVKLTTNSTTITPCCSNGFKECEIEASGDPSSPSLDDIKLKALARTCRSNPVLLKALNEWDIATGHTYKKPTIENPICCQFGSRNISIAPYNVEQVVLRYIRSPKPYSFGYESLPDGTYQFTNTGTVQSEWEQTARQYIHKGMSTLYSIFARDGEMNEGNLQIKKIGFF